MNNTEEPQVGAGRPTTYRPNIHPQAVEEALGRGLSRAMAAVELGIHYDTFYQWNRKYPEFAEAVKRGADIADQAVVDALLKSATGHTEQNTYFPPNITAMIFWLKNRRPDEWRDKREVEQKIKITDLTEEELEQRIQVLLADDESI